MGTRPEIIKLAPVIKQLGKRSTMIIFTAQHYDYDMGLSFIEQLKLSKPDVTLSVKADSHPSIQISTMIKKISETLEILQPDNVIVQGDTNTVLAASLAATSHKIKLSHIEAGLRSHDWKMPEERNRVLTDHISDLLFAPTKLDKENLISENVHGKIFVTGNTVIDSINYYSKISKKYSTLQLDDNYILLTLHRNENISDSETLSAIIKAIIDSKQNFIWPLHPHTKKSLEFFGLYNKVKKAKNIKLLKPVTYFELIELMKNCTFIVTDSGGIQEEATAPAIRKKTLIIRKSTERLQPILEDMSYLAGLSYRGILTAINQTVKDNCIPRKKSPFGSGNSSKLVVKHLKNNL